MPIQAVLFDLFNTLIMVRDGDAFYMPALKQLHKTLTRNNINIPFDDFKHEYFQVRDKLYTKAETNLEEPHFNITTSLAVDIYYTFKMLKEGDRDAKKITLCER